jgi:hypothetical protein
MNGELGTAAGRSDLVRLALRLIVEEAFDLGEQMIARGDHAIERFFWACSASSVKRHPFKAERLDPMSRRLYDP